MNEDLLRRVQLKATGANVHTVNGALSYYIHIRVYDHLLDVTKYYEEADKVLRIFLFDGDAEKLKVGLSKIIREVSNKSRAVRKKGLARARIPCENQNQS